MQTPKSKERSSGISAQALPFSGDDPPRPVVPPAAKSFAAVAAGSRSSGNGFFRPIQLAPRQYGTKDGCPAVSFSSSEIQEASSRLQHSLIAKFSGGRPHIEVVRKAFISSWKLQGDVSIGAWDSRHVLIVLKSEQDACRILASSVRKVDNYWFRLFRWTHDFDSKKEPTTTTTWIKLLALPPNMYDAGIIKAIVSSFGRYLGVDEKTSSFSNPSFARVCVEVDLSHKIPDKIWISGSHNFWLKLEYESRLQYCTQCRLHGHSATRCRNASRKEKPVESGIPVSQANPENQGKSVTDGKDGENVGDWVKVSKKGARRNESNIRKSGVNAESMSPDILGNSNIATVESPENLHPDCSNGQNDKLPVVDQNTNPIINAQNNSISNVALNDTQIVVSDTTKENNHDAIMVEHGKEPVANPPNVIADDKVPIHSEKTTTEVPVPLPEDKIASYDSSNVICYDTDDARVDARDVYLRLKAKYDDDALIFQIMDNIYEVAKHAQKEASNGPIEASDDIAAHAQKEDSSGHIEASDGSVDLSRIFKQPRQKTKGSRHSGRSRPKKKDSNYVW